jgi:NADPH2:quinone reductase
VDRRDPQWPDAVRRLAPNGVDIVLDPVGGQSWRQGYALLAPLGRLVCFGASEVSVGVRRNMLRVLWKALRWPQEG